jgi:hypothetical protein
MRGSGVLRVGWAGRKAPVSWVRVVRRLVIIAVVALATAPAAASAASWSPQLVPAPPLPNGELGSVSCPITTFCVSIGSYVNPAGLTVPFARAMAAGRWVNVPVPQPAGALVTNLDNVSCSSPSACTAVGSYEPRSGGTLPLVERFDGSKITIQPSPAPGPVTSVSCPSASYCVAVGQLTPRGSAPFAMSWNGSVWTLQTFPIPAGGLEVGVSDVACSSPSACTAVGAYVPDDGQGFGVTLAERWNGTAWSVQPTDDPSDSTDAEFSGVACVSGGSCEAVGDYGVNGDAPQTLAESWNGSTWSLQATPDPPMNFSELNSVSCTAPSSCTAVGFLDIAVGPDGQQAKALHWDGHTWTVQPTPLPSGDTAPPFDALDSVSCPSVTLCIAVGDRQSAATGTRATLTDRWDGARWSVVPAADPEGAQSGGLRSVSCVSIATCVAVGGAGNGALADRWDGSAWTTSAVPASNALNVVSCSDATDCMAVGVTGPSAQPLVERWDGSAWTIQATPELTNVFDPEANSVSCASRSACTLVGGYFSFASDQEATLAERWNGTSWSIQPTPNPTGQDVESELNAVSCPTTNWCAAVGRDLNNGQQALIETWDGTSWSLVPAIDAVDASLTAVSCSSPTACIATGSDSPAGIAVERWNGAAWTLYHVPDPSGRTATISALSCTSETSCTAVGSSQDPSDSTTVGLIEHWDGTTLSNQTIATPPGASGTSLSGVSCVSAVCEAVGSANLAVQLPLAGRYG